MPSRPPGRMPSNARRTSSWSNTNVWSRRLAGENAGCAYEWPIWWIRYCHEHSPPILGTVGGSAGGRLSLTARLFDYRPQCPHPLWRNRSCCPPEGRGYGGILGGEVGDSLCGGQDACFTHLWSAGGVGQRP